ncbi:MAG: O-antigen ligase family protein [bacterium]|nr:O-antigen ligase family protein [bacterium]
MFKSKLISANVWLFLLLVVLTPFSIGYVWRTPLAISYLNLLAVALTLLSLTNLILGSLQWQKVGSKGLVYAIGLMALMLIWGSLFSQPLRSILGPWTSRFLQPLLVGYIGYTLLKQNHLKLSSLVTALWVGLALVATLGLLQWGGVVSSNNISRLTGFYASPNSFARYIELLLLLLAPYLLLVASRFRLGLALIWLGGLAVMLGTLSYGGTASFAIGLTVIILFLPQAWQRLKIGFLILVIGSSLLAGIYREYLPKYNATTTASTSSLNSRQQFWQIAWGAIKEHPLTGIGLEGWERQYPELAQKHLSVTPIEAFSVQPHNIYLDAMLRAGILGLVAIIYLLFWPIVTTVRLAKSGLEKLGDDSWLVLGVLGYATSMILFGLVDDPIFSDDSMLMLFVIYFALASLFDNKKVFRPITTDLAV